MPKSTLTPWHEVVRLKDELRTGELTLAEFAADLHEVSLGLGKRPVYEDPAKFFALTYPTHAIRELVKDVALRLAGDSAKAVRQLDLTYGGGKTHTLITLFHLFQDPAAVENLPAVEDFRQHMGAPLPKAFPVCISFDKIDAERGIDGVRSPDGETRNLKHPWSVLAFQLAGGDGLRSIHAEGEDAERDTPPAEPLLVKLLEIPQRQDVATLILVDEVLMYARQKVGIDPSWRARVVDFFQYLVQAVTKVDRAAMVASLLATDPKKADALGRELQSDLFGIFRRQREEGVQPVGREDVAEVLRRRFFELDSISDPSGYQAHVIGLVRALANLDESTRKNRQQQEAEFMRSFPFHPDLTDVFYSRWTQLEGFQRTRGILRTLATALREAEKWDTCPVVGPASLLAAPDEPDVSDAVADLAGIASSEKTEGKPQVWRTLLEAELDKARQIQSEIPGLGARESEQAVVAVFLHSQPIGGKANTPEVVRMIGTNGPDLIELEKGLARWRDISWFLDDADAEHDDLASGALPKSWRLGNRPNLKQMHDESCVQRVTDQMVEERLRDEISKTRTLTEGARAAGAQPYMQPIAPRDLRDDVEFSYAVMGADAASDSGKPSALARRFIEETTGPDKPRVNRNMVVLVVPSKDGVAAARDAVRALLGWEDVRDQLSEHMVDAMQTERLRRRLQDAARLVPDTIRAAWSVVVTVNEQGETQAFKLPASAEPLFLQVKADERSRIKETAVDAEALLPDGPYDLWREDDDARYVSELANAFARNPQLPKMLKRRVVRDTIVQGIKRGLLVGRLKRPDGSVRTWWREGPMEAEIEDGQMQVVLPERAELANLDHGLLWPGVLPGLWDADRTTLADVVAYFGGDRTVTVEREGYDEVETIPTCDAGIVREAVGEAITDGAIWLTNGPTSVWNEPAPEDALADNAVLRPRPERISVHELTEDELPGAWKDRRTTGAGLERAISQARGEAMPWGLIREAIRACVDSRWLQIADGSHSLDAAWHDAANVRLERPTQSDLPTVVTTPFTPLDVHEIQELAEVLPDLLTASAGHRLMFELRVLLEDAPDGVRATVDKALAEIKEGLNVQSS